MAVSSATTTTICISQRDPTKFSSLTPTSSTLSFRFPSKKVSYVIRSSSDLTQETTTTTTDVDSESFSSSVESTKVPNSLISRSNIDKILRGIAITDVDHYDRLGIQRGCPYDQVPVAYKNKCDELKKQGLEEEEESKKLELLKESYSILSSEEERRIYDWSLSRSEKPLTYVWPFEADITQIQTQIPPPPEPEDVGPTRLVGYFMLGWFILALTLSVVLN